MQLLTYSGPLHGKALQKLLGRVVGVELPEDLCETQGAGHLGTRGKAK
ncbi:hypothetical protein ACWGR3_19705 [Streptomyces albidoflavus]|nr:MULTISPECIES: hypothetical protein [unclassified Streptomyces]MBV1957998.1 hypothetical protein [Streptomyces sp. BV333]UYX93188.1 hypothetical protein OIM89_05250 [Streptomyces sp. BI87]